MRIARARVVDKTTYRRSIQKQIRLTFPHVANIREAMMYKHREQEHMRYKRAHQ
jgi:hypothetical protein